MLDNNKISHAEGRNSIQESRFLNPSRFSHFNAFAYKEWRRQANQRFGSAKRDTSLIPGEGRIPFALSVDFLSLNNSCNTYFLHVYYIYIYYKDKFPRNLIQRKCSFAFLVTLEKELGILFPISENKHFNKVPSVSQVW